MKLSDRAVEGSLPNLLDSSDVRNSNLLIV